jgi:hypothetical protein
MSYVMMEISMMEMVVIVPVNQRILSMDSVEQVQICKPIMVPGCLIRHFYVMKVLVVILYSVQDLVRRQVHGHGVVMVQEHELQMMPVKRIG